MRQLGTLYYMFGCVCGSIYIYIFDISVQKYSVYMCSKVQCVSVVYGAHRCIGA
jgi:hypothetical protein